MGDLTFLSPITLCIPQTNLFLIVSAFFYRFSGSNRFGTGSVQFCSVLKFSRRFGSRFSKKGWRTGLNRTSASLHWIPENTMYQRNFKSRQTPKIRNNQTSNNYCIPVAALRAIPRSRLMAWHVLLFVTFLVQVLCMWNRPSALYPSWWIFCCWYAVVEWLCHFRLGGMSGGGHKLETVWLVSAFRQSSFFGVF